jgi:hypothetical protein
MTNSYDPNSPYEQLWQQAGQLAAQAPGGYPPGYQGQPAGGVPVAPPSPPPAAPAGSGQPQGIAGALAGLGGAAGIGALLPMVGGAKGFSSPGQVQRNFAPALNMAQTAAAGAPSAADALAQHGLNQAEQAASARAASARGNMGAASAQRNAQATGAGLAEGSIADTAARKANEEASGRQQFGQLTGQENQAEMAARTAQQGQANSTLGGITNAIGPALAMFSDERLKRPVEGQDAGPQAASIFLDHLQPRQFEWKNPHDAPTPNAGARTNLGVYAQDVEKAPQGLSMVADTPHGKVVDIHSLVGALAAGAGAQKQISDMHESRIAKLESMLGQKRTHDA